MTTGILAGGSQVALRDRRSSDVDVYLRWLIAGEWRHFDAPWEGIQESLSAEEEAKIRSRFLARLEEGFPTSRTGAIIETLDGTSLGWVNRYGCGPNPDAWCVGIDLCEDGHLNRGCGTEALTLWVAYLFEQTGIERLGLETWSFNPRMIRVAEKIGFQHEGTLQRAKEWQGQWLDKLLFGLPRADWAKRAVRPDLASP